MCSMDIKNSGSRYLLVLKSFFRKTTFKNVYTRILLLLGLESHGTDHNSFIYNLFEISLIKTCLPMTFNNYVIIKLKF